MSRALSVLGSWPQSTFTDTGDTLLCVATPSRFTLTAFGQFALQQGVRAPIASVTVTETGLDLRQLIQKFLLMAVPFSQGTDDYLDDDVGRYFGTPLVPLSAARKSHHGLGSDSSIFRLDAAGGAIIVLSRT